MKGVKIRQRSNYNLEQNLFNNVGKEADEKSEIRNQTFTKIE